MVSQAWNVGLWRYAERGVDTATCRWSATRLVRGAFAQGDEQAAGEKKEQQQFGQLHAGTFRWGKAESAARRQTRRVASAGYRPFRPAAPPPGCGQRRRDRLSVDTVGRILGRISRVAAGQREPRSLATSRPFLRARIASVVQASHSRLRMARPRQGQALRFSWRRRSEVRGSGLAHPAASRGSPPLTTEVVVRYASEAS